MPANTIVHRVFEFLSKYPPFTLVNEDKLLEIAAKVKIRYFDTGQVIFNEGDKPGGFIYLVRDGSVNLSLRDEVVDICDEGDLFGVRSMLSGKTYALKALTIAETLLYLIPIESFRPVLESNSEVAMYFAAGLAAGQTVLRDDEQAEVLQDKYQWKASQELSGIMPPAHSRLITCKKQDTIRTAARLMRQHRIGSLIIANDHGHPAGIITDTDLARKAATGEYGIDTVVENIMNHPVITIGENTNQLEMMITMMAQNIHHLCITQDGTNQSRALGIYSVRDLFLEQANHPAIIVKRISGTSDIRQLSNLRDKAEALLRKYLEQGIRISVIASVITIINDELIKKAISLALNAADQQFENYGLNFCWLSLGSEGRGEQLLRTDIDNAILYEDPPEGKKEEVKKYFLQIGEFVNNVLMQCGFEKCPAGIMASNPEFCLPLSEWQEKFRSWIMVPDPQALMNSTIFFDFRAVYGDLKLESALLEFLVKTIGRGGTFINHLAKNALQNPPPLTFFKDFMVEKGGGHKDEFDIKKRAMMPLADAARVLILSYGQPAVHNTSERFRKLGNLEPQQGGLYGEAAAAYEWLMGVRTRFGLIHNDSGRFLPVKSLNKMERQMLRNTFVPIKELQKLLEVRFQLNYF